MCYHVQVRCLGVLMTGAFTSCCVSASIVPVVLSTSVVRGGLLLGMSLVVDLLVVLLELGLVLAMLLFSVLLLVLELLIVGSSFALAMDRL